MASRHRQDYAIGSRFVRFGRNSENRVRCSRVRSWLKTEVRSAEIDFRFDPESRRFPDLG